jgi:hypothetical protein
MKELGKRHSLPTLKMKKNNTMYIANEKLFVILDRFIQNVEYSKF